MTVSYNKVGKSAPPAMPQGRVAQAVMNTVRLRFNAECDEYNDKHRDAPIVKLERFADLFTRQEVCRYAAADLRSDLWAWAFTGKTMEAAEVREAVRDVCSVADWVVSGSD